MATVARRRHCITNTMARIVRHKGGKNIHVHAYGGTGGSIFVPRLLVRFFRIEFVRGVRPLSFDEYTGCCKKSKRYLEGVIPNIKTTYKYESVVSALFFQFS